MKYQCSSVMYLIVRKVFFNPQSIAVIVSSMTNMVFEFSLRMKHSSGEHRSESFPILTNGWPSAMFDGGDDFEIKILFGILLLDVSILTSLETFSVNLRGLLMLAISHSGKKSLAAFITSSTLGSSFTRAKKKSPRKHKQINKPKKLWK